MCAGARRSSRSRMPNIVLFAPMPSANVPATVAVNPMRRRMPRSAKSRSWRMSLEHVSVFSEVLDWTAWTAKVLACQAADI